MREINVNNNVNVRSLSHLELVHAIRKRKRCLMNRAKLVLTDKILHQQKSQLTIKTKRYYNCGNNILVKICIYIQFAPLYLESLLARNVKRVNLGFGGVRI